MEELKHIKVTTPVQLDEGTTEFTTESYYEQLAHRMVELEKRMPTDRQHILKDLVNCLDLLNESERVVITIDAPGGTPIKITKRWLAKKESFKRV